MNNSFDLSIVVSVYNEAEGIMLFSEELYKQTNGFDNTEVIFVDDGSYDNSYNILKDIKQKYSNIRIINFSRNFGHEAAMLAGIDNSSGDYVICMDADLQHPPVKISEMLEKAKSGFDIVTAKRLTRNDTGLLNRILSKLFYKLLNKISPVSFEENASDFFLISKRIKLILKNEYRERNRFLRGFIQSVGFKKSFVEYDAADRVAGESNYNLFRLMRLSINAIASFSKQPLYLGIYLGGIFGVLSFVVLIYSLVMKLIGNTPAGYTTLIVIISLLFSIQFFIIGIIGIYIGYLFEEQKKRPIYIIDKFL